MPIYDYECQKCSERFEVFVRSKRPKIECPSCGGSKAKKLPSLFGFKSSSSFKSSSNTNSSTCKTCTKSSCQSCQ